MRIVLAAIMFVHGIAHLVSYAVAHRRAAGSTLQNDLTRGRHRCGRRRYSCDGAAMAGCGAGVRGGGSGRGDIVPMVAFGHSLRSRIFTGPFHSGLARIEVWCSD